MDWTKLKGASCLPDCWCEAARIGNLILEPINTWTNLTFIILGLIVILRPIEDKSNELTTHKSLNTLYGVAMVIVGAGSFFFHASQTFLGQWFDVFGMYLVALFYIFYNPLRSKAITLKNFYSLYIVSNIILGLVIIYLPQTRRYVFGVLIAITLFQTIYTNRLVKTNLTTKYFVYSLLCYIIAQTFWVLDKKKIWCNPHASLINGHGIWHILTAFSAYFIYRYFRSEKCERKHD